MDDLDRHLPSSTEDGSGESLSPASPPRLGVREIYGEWLTPGNILFLGLAAVLGGIGLLGGWKQVPEKQALLSQVQAGQVIHAEPFDFTFARAYWYTFGSRLPFASSGSRTLMLVADVTNTSKNPVHMSILKEALRLQAEGLTLYGHPTPAEKAEPDIYRGSDLEPVRYVQPGLKTRIAVIWQQQPTQTVPPSLTVVASSHEFKASSLSGVKGYLSPTPVASINIPLKAAPSK